MTIGDLAADDEGSIAIGPFGSSMKADTYTAAGIPVVRGNNLTGQPGFFGDFVFVPEELARRFPRCLLQPGDLVFPHRGAIGEVGLTVDQGYATWMLSTSMMKLRVHPSRVDPHFAFYYFRSRVGRHQLLRNASQVGTPGIGQPLASLRACEIALPPLAEQRAIVGVLRALDHKIEHNRKTSRTLEGLARAMFKAWFVDFEPIHAKASGATSFPGMPAEAFAALPTRFTDSELGPVPEGWSVGTIDGLCSSITSGGTPSRKIAAYWTGGNIDWFKTGELFDGPLITSEERISAKGLENSSCKLWSPGTVLFALYASPTVGRLGILTRAGTSNQAAAGLVAREEFGVPFLVGTLLFARDEFQRIAVGAAQQNINQGVLRNHRVVTPRRNLAKMYSVAVSALSELQANLLMESRKLAELRDCLLPKLLSGEVRASQESFGLSGEPKGGRV